MTKGTTHGKSNMANAAKQTPERAETGNGELKTGPSVQSGAEGLRGGADNTARADNQPSGDTANTSTPDQSRVPKIVSTVPSIDAPAKKASRVRRVKGRLSAAAVARLRTPIGELIDAHKPKPAGKNDLPIKSYEFGYQSGYAAGEQDQKDLRRLQFAENQGVTPRNLKIFQASTIFLLGVLIGLIF